MEKQKSRKIPPNQFIEPLKSFMVRFVAFTEEHKAYFDYLKTSSANKSRHLEDIDPESLEHMDKVMKIFETHQRH